MAKKRKMNDLIIVFAVTAERSQLTEGSSLKPTDPCAGGRGSATRTSILSFYPSKINESLICDLTPSPVSLLPLNEHY